MKDFAAPDTALEERETASVRRATAVDRPGVERLLQQAHTYDALPAAWPDLDNLGRGALLVAEAEREIVGAAWLAEGDNGPQIGMALLTVWNHVATGQRLLTATAERARDLGLHEFSADIPYEDTEALDALRRAGFRVAGAISFGGTTRIDLRLAPAEVEASNAAVA